MSEHDPTTALSAPAGPSSCAEAATTKEAAFRIDYALAAARNTRVVALDAKAERLVRSAALLEWAQARFFTVADPGDEFIEVDGGVVPLGQVVTDTNTVIMVSTTGENRVAVAKLGTVCRAGGVMTAGLVMDQEDLASDALLHLRPHTRILLVPADDDDLIELLRATRA